MLLQLFGAAGWGSADGCGVGGTWETKGCAMMRSSVPEVFWEANSMDGSFDFARPTCNDPPSSPPGGVLGGPTRWLTQQLSHHPASCGNEAFNFRLRVPFKENK